MTPVETAEAATAANVYGKTQEERRAYRERSYEIRDTFAADLARENLPGEPAAVTDAVFEWAWREGHAEGFRLVAEIYADLVDLVEKVRR